jgi:hypothetical protein
MRKDDFLKIIRSNSKKELDEQELAFFGSIGQAVEEAFTADSVTRKKELEGITNILGGFDEGQTAAGIIRNLAAEIDAIKNQSKRSLGASDKFKLRKALEDNKEVIQRAAKSKEHWALEFQAKRAAAMMTSTTMVTGTVALATDNFLEDVEVMVIQYPKNFILDAINSRQVAKVPQSMFLKYETTSDKGAPALVAEGAVKPLVSKTFAREYFYREKYAGRIEYTEETEIDFEQLLQQVIAMFEEDVLRVWQDAVLAKVVAYASAYTSSALDGTQVSPDVYGVIMAGMAWGSDNNSNYDQLLMNPGDYWAIKGAQDANGNYKINPFSDGFAGLNLTLSNKITAGTLILGTKQTIKEQHGAFILRSGQYADQLIENEYTIIGEIFSVTQLPTMAKPSWLALNITAMKDILKIAGA